MSAPSNRRRRGDRAGGHEGADERWLLTYSDMITLLMALFIVLWSISSVNISKFTQLKQSLQQAFSGKILAGSPSVLTGQAAVLESPAQQTARFADPAQAIRQSIARSLQRREQANLRRIASQVQSYAKAHGLTGLIRTSVDERGLVIRLLTDRVLFDTGEARLKPAAVPLVTTIARLLAGGGVANPVRVEGNTDDVPIATPEFPSNWELSTARADAVLQVLLAHGVSPGRLSVAGYGAERPLASNASAAGRARNRRVELVVLRRAAPEGGPTP